MNTTLINTQIKIYILVMIPNIVKKKKNHASHFSFKRNINESKIIKYIGK